MPKKTVLVEAHIGKSYEVDLTTRHFSLKIDQPQPSGNDTAPTPLEFFFFAIGACACSTGKSVATQKKIKLNSISASVEGDIDTDFLLGKTNEGRAGFTNIRISMEIDADISVEQKRELLDEITKRCPVSDNVEHVSHVKWSLGGM